MRSTTRPETLRSFAARLVELHGRVMERERADMVHITTAELCRALGKPDGASMEEVKAFVCELLPILDEAGFSAVCGCGFLALQVVPKKTRDLAFEEDRDLTSFTPADLQAYLAGS